MPNTSKRPAGSGFEDAKRRSHERLTAFLKNLPTGLNLRDDQIAGQIRRENASARSKLGKIYALMAEVGKAAAPYVACGKGCSACCKMNVSISAIEAERLSAASGRRMAALLHPIRHPEDRYAGEACPFLVDDACSVYEVRPYACRAHYSFDTSDYWCHPERAYNGEMSLLQMGGAREAYNDVVVGSRFGGFADIRDFFPGRINSASASAP